MKHFYTMGQIAKAAGIGIEAIRFYERKGLIPKPPRRASGYRQFPQETLDRLHFICKCYVVQTLKGELTMNKTISTVGVMAFVFLLASSFACSSKHTQETVNPDLLASAKECNFKIDGMTCAACAAGITSKVEGIVLDSHIDVKEGTGHFSYTDGATTCEEIASKVGEAGFKATIQ